MVFTPQRESKLLRINNFKARKNIFKKMTKIPPGELQQAQGMIKWGRQLKIKS